MSSKRYIEFDSTYRNRNCYPCPSEFTTKITCNKTENTGITASDYVANEYPSNSWYQIPYAGSDTTDMLNKNYLLPSINFNDNVTDIPIIINGKSYASMFPIDWLNGATPTYFSKLTNNSSNGPISIGSGVTSKTVSDGANNISHMGTRFQGIKCDGVTNGQYNSPNNNNSDQRSQFWLSQVIRNNNIIAPEKFSGGTASAPQLGQKSREQGKSKNYFNGAMIFRFITNPLCDMNTNANGVISDDSLVSGQNAVNNEPLLGSLGFPYYYQKLSFSTPPPSPLSEGTLITGKNQAGVKISGFIACIISQQEIIVRLGAAIPIGNGTSSQVKTTGLGYKQDTANNKPPRNVFPGVPPNLETVEYTEGLYIKFANNSSINMSGVIWDIPSNLTDAFPAYFWCGYVETAIITSYDTNTGIVTLDNSFSSSGTNSFNTNTDFYLIDFNTDPSGHWKSDNSVYSSIENGKPRLFFPGGLDIPNYYSGRKITNITAEELTTEIFGLQDSTVTSYNDKRKVLYVDNSIIPSSPAFRGVQVCSQYTLVFLQQPLGEMLPAGSFISWNGNSLGGTYNNPSPGTNGIPCDRTNEIPGVYYVAINAPINSTCIVLQGARDPTQISSIKLTSSILNMVGGLNFGGTQLTTAQPNILAGSVQVPPYSSQNVLDYWRNTYNWINLKPDTQEPLNISSLLGAQTILVRDKKVVPLSNNLIPYTPMSSFSIPKNCPAVIRKGGVVSLKITDGGKGYKVTDKKMPIMAIIREPNSWDTSQGFINMMPVPEKFTDNSGNDVYTFLNICFVNVTAVSSSGEILEIEINTPGSGYQLGSILQIIDGSGEDVTTYDAQSGASVQWTNGTGKGATARITGLSQIIGVGASTEYELPNVPKKGDLLYIPTYGWGLNGTKNIYNSAPSFGKFQINFSSSGNEYQLLNSELPRKLNGCVDAPETYPEMGTRLILDAWKSTNNQVLISPEVYNWTGPGGSPYQTIQYAAPGSYLGGYYGIDIIPGRPTIKGSNHFTWIALEKEYDLSSFKNTYAFSQDVYVSGNYTFSRTGTYSDIGKIADIQLIPQGIPDNTNDLGQWVDKRETSMGQKNIPTGYVQGALPLPNSLTNNWLQIITFNRNNEQPLNYTGSTASQNQMVCYEIELISLILPNLPLDNKIGGLIAFYPYLYVELSNQTSPSSGSKGIIYSNNPHANKALFRVAIDDTPTPLISKFIKVDGDGAVQTVKFKPNDNLYFRVFLSNGDLFETDTKDNPSPAEPNSFVQISAQFSIKRLD
jgi:hypothetical protein